MAVNSLLLLALVGSASAGSKLVFKDGQDECTITLVPGSGLKSSCDLALGSMSGYSLESSGISLDAAFLRLDNLETAVAANTKALSELTAALDTHKGNAATDTELAAVKRDLDQAIKAVSKMQGPRGERGARCGKGGGGGREGGR